MHYFLRNYLSEKSECSLSVSCQPIICHLDVLLRNQSVIRMQMNDSNAAISFWEVLLLILELLEKIPTSTLGCILIHVMLLQSHFVDTLHLLVTHVLFASYEWCIYFRNIIKSKKESSHDKQQKRALREKTNLKLSNMMKNFVISNEVDAKMQVQKNLQSASNLKEGDCGSRSCDKNILEDAEIFSKVDVV